MHARRLGIGAIALGVIAAAALVASNRDQVDPVGVYALCDRLDDVVGLLDTAQPADAVRSGLRRAADAAEVVAGRGGGELGAYKYGIEDLTADFNRGNHATALQNARTMARECRENAPNARLRR